MIKNWTILHKFDSVYVDYLTSQVFDLNMVHIGFAEHSLETKTFIIRENQFKTKNNNYEKQKQSNVTWKFR